MRRCLLPCRLPLAQPASDLVWLSTDTPYSDLLEFGSGERPLVSAAASAAGLEVRLHCDLRSSSRSENMESIVENVKERHAKFIALDCRSKAVDFAKDEDFRWTHLYKPMIKFCLTIMKFQQSQSRGLLLLAEATSPTWKPKVLK